MDTHKYRRVKELFEEVLGLPVEDRPAFVSAVGRDDAELERELRSLLDYHDDERTFLDPDAEPAPQPLHPDRIGRYRILHEIGRGGMGVVYEAEQDTPRRTVALKVLHPGLVSADGLRRFELEAEVLGRLQHPGIAQVHDARTAPESGAQPYLAMERVHGVPIVEWANAERLGTPERLALMARVSDAVHHAHQRGVIHRDLKPDNILVDDAGQPKILDFGIARVIDTDLRTMLATRTGQVVGTIAYMSPEQASGEFGDVDTRCDVYALGVITYELLAGERPHDLTGLELHLAVRKIAEDEPKPLSKIRPGLRGDVATIVHKAMEKDRERRYASAGEFAQDMRRFLAHEAILARPTTAIYQLKRFARRHKVLVGGAAATTAVLVIGLISTLVFAFESQANERRALRALYRTRIASTLTALRRHDLRAAEVPFRAITDPAERRNWEYRYLHNRLRPVVARHDYEPDPQWTPDRDAIDTAGRPLVAHARGGELVVVELTDSRPIASLAVGTRVSLPTLSIDGSLLAAVAHPDRALVVWDMSTTREVLRWPLTEREPERLAFAPDNAALALVEADAVTTIDARTGSVLWSRPLSELTSQIRLTVADHVPQQQIQIRVDASWSHDEPSRLVVSRTLPHVSMLHVSLFDASGELVQAGWQTDAACLAVSPDGRTFALGTNDMTRVVRLFDVSSLGVLGVLEEHFGGVVGVTYSPDGRRLATATPELVRIWDAASRTTLASFPVEIDDLATLRWRGDKLLIADRATARVFDVSYGSSLELRGHTTFVYMVSVSSDGSTIATRDYNAGVRMWDAITGEALASWPITGIAKVLGFTPEGSRLISSAVGLSVFDTATGRRLAERPWDVDDYFATVRGGAKHVGHSFAGESRATSPDGSLLVAGTEDGKILVSDRVTGAKRHELAGHEGIVFAVAVSRDNRYLASGGADRKLCLWDLATGSRIAVADHASKPYSLNFSPDGRRLVSGGDDSTILLWDVPELVTVAHLEGHTSYVHSVAFSPDGSYLVSASGDHTVRIWDTVPRGERLRQASEARALRAKMEPMVVALGEELDDPAAVAARLRSDAELSDDERRAALRVLLRLSLDEAHRPTDGK